MIVKIAVHAARDLGRFGSVGWTSALQENTGRSRPLPRDARTDRLRRGSDGLRRSGARRRARAASPGRLRGPVLERRRKLGPLRRAPPEPRGPEGPAARPLDVDALLEGEPDVVFLATPNETSAELVPLLLDWDPDLRIVDLSGAFRLTTPTTIRSGTASRTRGPPS